MADPNMTFVLTLKDADRREALDDVFHQAGRAVVYDDDPDGVVTVHKADLSFHDTLELLLPTGFTADEIGGVYHIRKAA